MPESSPTLTYETRRPSYLSNWLASLSVFCITTPAFCFVALLLTIPLSGPQRLLTTIIGVAMAAGPVIGLSFAITAIVLRTPRKGTAIAGLIGCSAWLLLMLLPPLIKTGSAPAIAPPPPAPLAIAPR